MISQLHILYFLDTHLGVDLQKLSALSLAIHFDGSYALNV